MFTTNSRRLAWAAPAGVLALTLAACGQDGSASGDGKASPIPELSDGVLTVATTGTYKPMSFNEDGKLQGWDVDWANIFGEELGVKVEFVEGPVAGLVTGLQAGQFDVVMASLTITPERQQSIDFSTPYVADGVVATALASDTTVTDINNLDGLAVGMTAGSGYIPTVENIGGYTELKEYPGSPEAFADLVAGRIDAYLTGRISATTYTKDSTGTDKVVVKGEPFELMPAGIGIQKGHDDLNAAISEIVEEKIEDGTFDELCEKWFGFSIDKSSLVAP